MSYRLRWLLVSGILIPLASSQRNLYDVYLLLCVQCYTPDDGRRNCPKHIEFYSKNKFEKLVHLVGFIIRIYHDARSFACSEIPSQKCDARWICFWHSKCWCETSMFVSKVESRMTTCDRFPYMARRFLYFADTVSRLVLSSNETRILSVKGSHFRRQSSWRKVHRTPPSGA